MSEVLDRSALERTRRRAIRALLDARNGAGHWRGELSSSALSTATAVMALAHLERAGAAQEKHRDQARAGARWLVEHQNDDGGWGDTITSPSNPSTTTLAWVALGLVAAGDEAVRPAETRAERWLEERVGTVEPAGLARALLAAYGEDRTFSVPILVTCALGGRLGEGSEAWRRLPPIPFELAALPHGFFRFLRLPMVSYALPALIAIGQVIHRHRRTRVPGLGLLRDALRGRTLRKLTEIQPAGGGFLEATPLTSFVTISLLGCGLTDHPVIREGVGFLERSMRPDGSWPIDTDLATWATTLAVNGLAAGGELERHLPAPEAERVRRWLEGQQCREVHPYTRAAPGGWAWTDLPGGVPDADDTPGAVLALTHFPGGSRDSAPAAVRWLLDLQNGDGGIPTFCRGWGKLPFDRSSPDLTAHTLRAFAAAREGLPADLVPRVEHATARAVRYLVRIQRGDGAWVPLWFGNQHEAHLENPVYGTARVLLACETLVGGGASEALERGTRWLVAAQNGDGGFGGAPGTPSTLEETALALEALAGLEGVERGVLERAVGWLIASTDEGRDFPASPIGLYFAKLWYSEALYPLVFTVAALERAAVALER